MEDGTTPDPALQTLFLDALARLIRDAMRPDPGDPAFQAMVLRHRMPHVREYASLSADAEQDRRRVRALINPYPHPDRHRLARAALARLQRRNALRNDTWVQRYEALWRRHGPPSGSTGARLDGEASRRRGAAMESRAAQAIEALAQRLEADSEEGTRYSVVTSLHVPASIDTPRARAKTEWDVALLGGSSSGREVCLLVEAKASVDAATTDFPRLLRGLRLLGSASGDADYIFESAQGPVRLRGSSLRALGVTAADPRDTVLYCVDAPVEPRPRPLGAASRMQLLSAQASLDYATALAEGNEPAPRALEAVWHALLSESAWRPVLYQYATQRRVRELMVHVDDLLAAVAATAAP